MSESTTAIECLDEAGHGLRVIFVKQGDRFVHNVFRAQDGKSLPLLSSVEGTSEDLSPPSPPFAELHQQGEIIFLSGATTLGHWSASVCARENCLEFEVACRLKKPIARLGSTYKVLGDSYEVTSDNQTVAKCDPQSLRIAPIANEDSSYPLTLQWRYGIAIKS